jgi:hypothetical protein
VYQTAVHRRHGSDGLRECRDPAEVPFLWLVEVAQSVKGFVPDFVRWKSKPGNTRSCVDSVVDELFQCEHGDQGRSPIPSASGGVADQCVGQRRVSAVGETERDRCESPFVELRIALGGVIVVTRVVLSHRTGGHSGNSRKGGRGPHGEEIDRNDESQWIEWCSFGDIPLPRSAFILTRPSSAAQTQCRRLTLRQKATRVEASICMMTIDACQSISASSQLLCLISIRLIDLDLSGNYVSPPSPHTAVRSVQPVSQDVDRINDKGGG